VFKRVEKTVIRNNYIEITSAVKVCVILVNKRYPAKYIN